MIEQTFDFQQGAISTPLYNHQGFDNYEDPLQVINPSDSSQLLSSSQQISDSDTVIKSIVVVKDILTGLKSNSEIDGIMENAFGTGYSQDIADQLFAHFEQNNFNNTPDIKLVSGQSFNGAYAKKNNTIYLSQEFVVDNLGNVDAVTALLLEEFAHYIDGQINVVDAVGDEGDIFSRLVRGENISDGELVLLKGEHDHGVLVVDGFNVGIEKSEIAFASLNSRLYQSIRGQDNGIYTRSSTDGVNWTHWNNNGGGSTSGGVDLEVLNGRLYQSHRGLDDKIYTRSSTDGVNWTGWNNNGGGDTLSDPSLAVLNGRLYQSHRGLDNKIYTRSSTDGLNWTGWNNNGGGDTPSAPVIEAFNGRLYQSHRGLDNRIYTRSSTDGLNWTGWNNNGGGDTLNDPSLEAFNGRLYQSHRGLDNRIYTRSSTDGLNWTGWSKSNSNDVESYHGELSSLTDNDWNYQSRDNLFFDGNTQNGESLASVKQVYSDLSNGIFDSYKAMTAGYFDTTNYSGTHYGIDMAGLAGNSVKTVVGGTTTLVQNIAGNFFIGVKGDDGNLWIYGHLENYSVGIGSRVEAGTTIGTVFDGAYHNGYWMAEHLHLEVHKGHNYNRANSISPLQAYWNLRN